VMDDRGKSDDLVLPTKLPNNAQGGGGGGGGGKGIAQGKRGQRNTPQTQRWSGRVK
jgi:hypothetical protein